MLVSRDEQSCLIVSYREVRLVSFCFSFLLFFLFTDSTRLFPRRLRSHADQELHRVGVCRLVADERVVVTPESGERERETLLFPPSARLKRGQRGEQGEKAIPSEL